MKVIINIESADAAELYPIFDALARMNIQTVAPAPKVDPIEESVARLGAAAAQAPQPEPEKKTRPKKTGNTKIAESIKAAAQEPAPAPPPAFVAAAAAQGSLFDSPTPIIADAPAVVSGFAPLPTVGYGHVVPMPVEVFPDTGSITDPTPKQVSDAVGAYAKKHGLVSVQKILTDRFGVKQVKDLSKTQLFEFFVVMTNG